jgi:hypothetical protein
MKKAKPPGKPGHPAEVSRSLVAHKPKLGSLELGAGPARQSFSEGGSEVPRVPSLPSFMASIRVHSLEVPPTHEPQVDQPRITQIYADDESRPIRAIRGSRAQSMRQCGSRLPMNRPFESPGTPQSRSTW